MSGVVDTGPATGVVSITPSDTIMLAKITVAVWIGGEGDMSVLMSDDTSEIIKGIVGGTLLPCRVKRVNATGTTASDILGWYNT